MNKHETIQTYIKGLSLDYANSLIILGRAGQGKTETTLKSLRDLGYQDNIHFRYLTNFTTPVELFNELDAVNRLLPPKILVLDDCETMLMDKKTLGILKSALWPALDGTRKVNWNSSTYKIRKKEIFFVGKIIFLVNEFNERNPLIVALKDRGYFFEINLSREEMIYLMLERIEVAWPEVSKEDKLKVVELIKNKSELSLRDLPKAISILKLSPDHYRELILQ